MLLVWYFVIATNIKTDTGFYSPAKTKSFVDAETLLKAPVITPGKRETLSNGRR